MSGQDTVTIGGKTISIKEYLAIQEEKENRIELKGEFNSESRKFAIHVPQKERKRKADKNKVVYTKYYSMEGAMEPDKTVKHAILDKIFTDYPGGWFTVAELIQNKSLIEYKITRSNAQLVVQTLYDYLQTDPTTKDLIAKEKDKNSYIYYVSNDAKATPDQIQAIYDGMTQLIKRQRLRKAGVKLPPEKPKIVQPKKIETSPAPKQEKVVSVPQDININVRVTFEGFISFLFGIDRNGPIS
jgi:hypothetical protein